MLFRKLFRPFIYTRPLEVATKQTVRLYVLSRAAESLSQFLTVDVASAALGPRKFPDFQFMESGQGDLCSGFNDADGNPGKLFLNVKFGPHPGIGTRYAESPAVLVDELGGAGRGDSSTPVDRARALLKIRPG